MKNIYVERIRELYPDLELNQIEVNDIGQNNDVLIVNDTLVFRFPKYIEGINKLEKETKVLDHIKGKVSLPISYPQYRSFDLYEVGKVFTGYQLIEGSPLWPQTMKELNNEEQIQDLSSQLVEFLSELHFQPIANLDIKKQSVEDIRQSIVELYVNFKDKLFPYMNENSRSEVSQNFEGFLSNDKLLNFSTVLIHGDFGASNILWDSKRKVVSGVIDFGETEIGDPAYDFAGLLASYGQPFVERCLNQYPEGTKVLERIIFYKSTFALQEALHGFENNDIKAFENGIKDYR
ncbi:aminoglycoside 2''-phosphotransferase [Halobacillus dabanensis]|uniref:Aminoglycoside 2''-phosphotransferase n=1 Tax=Halobacillus dabanensis TaxID=240302 RepID=A0A1I4AYS5_HALDA|nr:phosphotransferase [Halobacillus dabanensis]SFK61594.1 aminoglycoside 2''-phosphotransferase [Halobacillus dabanensis]